MIKRDNSHFSPSRTFFARAVRVVERKHARRKPADAYAMLLAGIILGNDISASNPGGSVSPSRRTIEMVRLPSASESALSTESESLVRRSGFMTSRSTTISIVCFLFFWEASGGRKGHTDIRRRARAQSRFFLASSNTFSCMPFFCREQPAQAP